MRYIPMSPSRIGVLAAAMLASEAVFYAVPAHAYIGPALASMVYLLAPIAAVVGTAAILLFRPFKSLINWRRRNEKAEQSEGAKQKTE